MNDLLERMASNSEQPQRHSSAKEGCLAIILSGHEAQKTPELDVTNFEQVFRAADNKTCIVGGNSDPEKMEHRGATSRHLSDTVERISVCAEQYSVVFLVLLAPGNYEQIVMANGTIRIVNIIKRLNAVAHKHEATRFVLFIGTTPSANDERSTPQVDSDRLFSNLLVLQATDASQVVPGYKDGFYGSLPVYKFCQKLATESSVLESAAKVNREEEALGLPVSQLQILENGFQDFRLRPIVIA